MRIGYVCSFEPKADDDHYRNGGGAHVLGLVVNFEMDPQPITVLIEPEVVSATQALGSIIPFSVHDPVSPQ